MNQYTILSKAYSLLDTVYFGEKGRNPREVINSLIPDEKVKVLDMCCGTLSNSLKLAVNKPCIHVYGIDNSRAMLREACKRIREAQINNVSLKCTDATETGLADGIFDYVIIGLVLHESSPRLVKKILTEARRLLKSGGKLIILEWEVQYELLRRTKYTPLLIMEQLNCPTFKQFYTMDKVEYIEKYGFRRNKQYHCNYSVVIEFEKI